MNLIFQKKDNELFLKLIIGSKFKIVHFNYLLKKIIH